MVHPPRSTLRAELIAIIDHAFALLDRLDGGTDLEDSGDAEPWLACAEGRDYRAVWCVGCDDDRELS